MPEWRVTDNRLHYVAYPDDVLAALRREVQRLREENSVLVERLAHYAVEVGE